MKPEQLVSDDRIETLWMMDAREGDADWEAFLAGAHAVLEELGIVQVVETSYPDHWVYDGESTSVHVDLTKGAVLVKAKENP